MTLDATPGYNDPGEKYRPTDVLVQCPVCPNAFWQRRTRPSPETCGYRCAALLRAKRERAVRGTPYGMTVREAEVWAMRESGQTNGEIATALGLNKGTVKNAVRFARRKASAS